MNSLLIIPTAISLFILNCLVLKCESKSVANSLAEKELDCFSQSKIYHPQSDKCYKLLTTGPCQPGYWFVLEKPRSGVLGQYQDFKISAVCVKEKCPEGGYYWAKTKSCVQAKNKTQLCGNSSDEELLNNAFGEAECVCARDPVRARLDGNKNNRCYPLYTQGPCRRGEVLGFSDSDKDRATCIRDLCYEETVYRRNKGTLSKDGVLAPWTNGSCYELGTQGPCSDSEKFKVHQTLLRPNCNQLTTAIFDLEKPQKCYQDENGDCQKKISSNKYQNAEKYKQELFSSISAARKRRTTG